MYILCASILIAVYLKNKTDMLIFNFFLLYVIFLIIVVFVSTLDLLPKRRGLYFLFKQLYSNSYQWFCFPKWHPLITKANNCLEISYCFPLDSYFCSSVVPEYLRIFFMDSLVLSRLTYSRLATSNEYRSHGYMPFLRPHAPAICWSDDGLLPHGSYGLLL